MYGATQGFPGGASGKEPTYNAGDIKDAGLIPWSGRSPREGNGNPLQYSYLENPMDRGTWQATVHGVAKSWTRLSNFIFTFHFHFHTLVCVSFFFFSFIKLLFHLHELNTRVLNNYAWIVHENLIRH